MTNKLCCLVKAYLICTVCGEYWCRECCNSTSWADEHTHSFVRHSRPDGGNVYKCSIANEVRVDQEGPKEYPIHFIPV
jgi:hypothetical protein